MPVNVSSSNYLAIFNSKNLTKLCVLKLSKCYKYDLSSFKINVRTSNFFVGAKYKIDITQ